MSQENKNDVDDTPNIKLKDHEHQTPNHIGVSVDVTLDGFNGGQSLKAKIDTGAQASCLHAEDIDIVTNDVTRQNSVKFKFGEFSYHMSVEGFQAVTSADGGTTNRPVVRFGVRINGQYVPDVAFNLNDRSNMDYPVLIGLNLIQTAKLVIDANISEMEVSFGPEGMQKIDDAPAEDNVGTVDDNTDNEDNDKSEQSFDQKFLEWFNKNKLRTIEDVFSELIAFSKLNENKDESK